MGENGLDLQAALLRTDNDRELLRELAALMLEECPALMADLQTAIRSGDQKAIERKAHALKGSIVNFGCAGAVAAAASLELSARNGQTTDFVGRFAQLEEALEPLIKDLIALVEST